MQKIDAEIFESAVQAVTVKGEVGIFLKTKKCSQDHSVKCPRLFMSPSLFPVDFPGTSLCLLSLEEILQFCEFLKNL